MLLSAEHFHLNSSFSRSVSIQLILALVGEMVTKHGQAFKTNYSVKRGFHMTLMIPNRAVTFDFPAEIEVVSFNFDSQLVFTSISIGLYKFLCMKYLLLLFANKQLEIKRNTCYLTTSEVNKLNIRIQNVIEEIIMQSNV